MIFVAILHKVSLMYISVYKGLVIKQGKGATKLEYLGSKTFYFKRG